MNRSQKIAAAVSVLTVVGIAAVAAPAVALVASEIGGWALFDHPATAHSAAATNDPAATNDAVSVSDADVPAGYVNVGHGTFIPGGGPGDCESSSYIWIGSMADEPMHVEQSGADLVDMGPREFATGEVSLDDQGRPAYYTVAAGDVLPVIGDRFCIYNGMALDLLNGYSHGAVIQPGDVLTLNANLVTDWVYPYADE